MRTMCRWNSLGVLGLLLAGYAASAAELVIHADRGTNVIHRNLYGHFAEHLGRCVYEGFWVGEDSPIPNTRGIRNDVVAALKKIKTPVLRWPGGCFADDYHWMDGIGPRTNRPSMINVHWGGVTENNHFGTHEFFELCAQLDCAPYICGNLGSGTVREMRDWVEYCTFEGQSPMADLRQANGQATPWKLPFFGVGNENWGCGGSMTPEYYANEYKRYATYVKSFGGNRPFKIACGPNGGNTNWTEVLMREAGKRMDGLALHYYCGSGVKKQLATDGTEEDWISLMGKALRMDDLIRQHAAIMDRYDPAKKVALIVDEWGTWHLVEPGSNPGFLYQQNTLRDALAAGVTLNIFNRHCDRVKMANIAQTVNVLQAMVLTDKEKMLLTPTYHVFEMYTVHHDATLLPADLAAPDYVLGTNRVPALDVSASRGKDGKLHVTLCNLNPNEAVDLKATLSGAQARSLAGRVLTASALNAHNTFAAPDTLQPVAFTACALTADGFTATLPAKSVVALELAP